MKKREYVLLGLLTIFLVFSTFYGYMQSRKIGEFRLFLKELKQKSDVQMGRIETLKEYRFNEVILNGTNMHADFSVVDIWENKKKMSEVISDNTLILRYSEMHCEVCVDSIVKKLNVYKDSIGLQNIVLLTTSQNFGYMRRFKKINSIPFGIYNMDEALDSVLVDIGMPYLFVYSTLSKRINNVFVPQKEAPQLTDEYLHSILMKYYMD
ncbi:MAG: hypothetical protein EGQ20_00875 [Bacteroides oleiciplenus]|nr:hypothetical protein [Bacteroides oleiciplenus]